MIWEELTSPEFEQIDRNIPVVLPVAAIEQHGPNLPLATDKIIGKHFGIKLHEKLEDKVLILPTIAIGCSEHHLDFSGSLSVNHETLLRQVTDVFDSVVHHGFTNLVFLNSHGGNQAIGQVFIEKFGYRNQGVNVHMITWWKIAHEKLIEITETGFGGTGHAGEFETSLIMLIRPDLVRINKIEESYPHSTFDWSKQDMLHAPKVGQFKTFKEMTKNGAFGDPTKSSADKGKRIETAVIDECTRVLLDMQSTS